MQLNPYLYFSGDCEEALEFYKQVLGAEMTFLVRGNDVPDNSCPPEMADKILHANFTVNGSALMASDAPPPHYHKPSGFRVNINLTDPEKAREIFTAFAEGGSVEMKLEKTFWAQLFGMVTDKFGTPWMLNCA